MAEVITASAENQTPAAALALLVSVAGETDNTFGMCHSVAHAFGQAMYARVGEDAFISDSAACGFGYSHGLLEKAAAINGVSELKLITEKACSGVQGGGLSSCTHAYGHALQVAGVSPEESANMCTKVPAWFNRNDTEDSWRISRDCMNGWAMEQQFSDPSHESLSHSISESNSLCSGLEGGSGHGCLFAFSRNYVISEGVGHEAALARLEEFRKLCETEEPGVEIHVCREVLADTGSTLFPFVGDPDAVTDGLHATCGNPIRAEDICVSTFMDYQLDTSRAQAVYMSLGCSAFSSRESSICRAYLADRLNRRGR